MKTEVVFGLCPVVETLRSPRREVFEVFDAVGDKEVGSEAAARGVPVRRVARQRA